MLLAAQNFTYKSKIAHVPANGFYKVALSSNLGAYASAQYQDLRLIDNEGKEIPYLLKKENVFQSQTDFVAYNILENNTEGVWQTVIIDNDGKHQIDQFIFEMKNAETDRTVRISGSNDQEKWYVVRDRFYFISMGSGGDATVRQQITFPVSDYRYFKVEIRMKDKQALNILRVGYSNQAYKTPAFLKVNGLTFKSKDSNKRTLIQMSCLPANRIDKLVFHISAPDLFKRTGRIKKTIAVEESGNSSANLSMSSKKFRSTYTPEESFELNSETGRAVETSSLLGDDKSDAFTIEIENFDNMPLKIDSITAYQLGSTLTAEMKKDKSYFLYFGDSLLSAPSYDLVYFQNKIPADAASVEMGEVQLKSVPVKDEYNQSKDKMLVWIGLGVIAVILFVITGSMVKKMGKESAV
jgi:hypothetical protein